MTTHSRSYKLIPNELKQVKNWCCFKLEKNTLRDKLDKIPYNPKTGYKAQSNNPGTWNDFETCYLAYENGEYDGLGFFFNPPYFGVDIDKIEEDIIQFESGKKDNIVDEFVHVLQSYAEYSISKKGIHIICKGELPKGRRRKDNVEMYQEGRFFVMTGDSLEEYDEVIDCTQSIAYLHEKYLGKNETIGVNHDIESDLSVTEILECIQRSKQAEKFNKLFNGDFAEDYPSQSEADYAFASMLAFWTACDEMKMDTIFRQSKLYREKYDRKQGNSTYGELTIRNAVTNCGEVFQPKNNSDYSIVIENMEDETVHTFDDTGNAHRFVARFRSKALYNYSIGKWMIYNGSIWTAKDSGAIKLLADHIVNNMKKEYAWIKEYNQELEEEKRKQLTKHINRTRSSKGKENMLKEAQHILHSSQEDYDNDIYLFNTQNGYLNLRDGKLNPHRREKRMTKISNVEFTDKTTCDHWLKFLNEIFLGNQELIDYIQRALGYSLSGSTDEQCMFILVGNGRNGKSVFLDVLKEIYGTYCNYVQSENLMSKAKLSGANPEIARLLNTRFVVCSESQEGERLNETMIKQLTGGDIVSVRGLYQATFEFKPQFKIWMATNHKPIIRGTDLGIWRRLHLIKFDFTVEEERIDKHLTYKLKRELPGILNWIFEGFLKYKRLGGLNPPACVLESVREYRNEMDVISQFIDECCLPEPGFEIKASVVYDHYKKWAKQNEQYVMNSTKFGIEMSKRYEKIKKPSGMFYVGIKSNFDGI